MTNALARISQVTGYERDQIQLVKDTIARGASDDELILFLHLARRSGLDPFARQIYLIERRANVGGQWVTTRQPQTAIDGLRLIADRTERYAPGHEPTFEYDADGRLIKATAYIKKFVRGEWHEVAASAHYEEYVGRTGKGEITRMWVEKPHIMLAKCAEALALRRAFPAEMSGLYTGDEMGETAAPTVVDVRTGEIVDEPRKALPEASYEPSPEQPAKKSETTPAEAEQRFFARYGEIVGGQSWSFVQAYLMTRAARPKTLDGWIAVAEDVKARVGLLTIIEELTSEALDLDLVIELKKPLDEMLYAELEQHKRNLHAAIAEAQARDIQPIAA